MQPVWSPESIESLRQWCEAGFSAGAIANKFGAELGVHFSRNAVIGKIHRLGFKLLGNRSGGESKRDDLWSPRKPRAVGLPRRTRFDPPPVTAPLNIGLLELTPLQCRQVTGDDHCIPPLYCGHPAHHDRPYCLAHCCQNYINFRAAA